MPRIDTKSNYSPYAIREKIEFPITKISSGQFKTLFSDADKIQKGQNTWSDQESITVPDIKDSIAVFTIAKESQTITRIIAHHFENLTDRRDIEGEMDGYIKEENHYELYIIGNGQELEDLLKNIKAVAKKLFKGKTYQILGEYFDLNDSPRDRKIAVNLQMDGVLTYCLH